MGAYAYTYVLGPPYSAYALRVPASCVPYVPKAQGSLPQGAAHCTGPYAYQPRPCRTYRVPWHHRWAAGRWGATTANRERSERSSYPEVEEHGQSAVLAIVRAQLLRLLRRAWRLWATRHSQEEVLGGSGQPERPTHWAPSHCLGCSKSPTSQPLSTQEESSLLSRVPFVGKCLVEGSVVVFVLLNLTLMFGLPCRCLAKVRVRVGVGVRLGSGSGCL